MTFPTTQTTAPWLGLPVGVNDRHGNPIHFGDVLHFDPDEWGSAGEYFCVDFVAGEVVHSGSLRDLSEWCSIVRKWDADTQDAASSAAEVGPFATRILPRPLPHGPEVWPMLLKRLDRVRDLPIHADLVAEMQARRDVGLARYGQTLHRDDGRPLGVDAFQECLDLLVYLERDLMRLWAGEAYRYLAIIDDILTTLVQVLATLYSLCRYPPSLQGPE